MANHKTGTRDQPSQRYGSASEWLAARLELLEAEKELTQRSDERVLRLSESVNPLPSFRQTFSI